MGDASTRPSQRTRTGFHDLVCGAVLLVRVGAGTLVDRHVHDNGNETTTRRVAENKVEALFGNLDAHGFKCGDCVGSDLGEYAHRSAFGVSLFDLLSLYSGFCRGGASSTKHNSSWFATLGGHCAASIRSTLGKTADHGIFHGISVFWIRDSCVVHGTATPVSDVIACATTTLYRGIGW